MRKISLFMLMAVGLLISGNAGAAERTAGTFSDLQNALTNASNGDVIKLTADIAYATNGSGLINITKSITLDGQGHKISGYGSRSGNKTTIAINNGGSNMVSVTFQNLTIENAGAAGRAIETRGKITSFTLDNCSIQCTGGGNTQPLTIGGSQSTAATLSITNSYLYAGSGGYPVISFNPYNLTTKNTTYKGFCAMYFKGPDGSEGSHGTTINATDCYFDAPNVHSGATNSFGVFELEEGGINITLVDCGMNAEELGDQGQELFVFSSSKYNVNTLSEPSSLTISGNNSHLNGQFYYDCWASSNPGKTVGAHTIIITGGTYSVNPSNAPNTLATRYEIPVGNTYNNFVDLDHYEVSEVKQYDSKTDTEVTLYRVHPKAAKDEHGVAYTLNNDVEGQGGGQNPNTSFILSADETVTAEKTYAEYVEIQSGKITIPEGKTLSIGEAGLVVKSGASMVVEPGGTVTVSKGGTITASEQSIVIQSNVDATGNYLVDPAVTFNQQPLAKVELFTTAKKGKWQRFAFPLVEGTYGSNVTNNHEDLTLSIVGGGDFGTAINEWDYVNDKWKAINATTPMVPFIGYALSNNSNEGGVTYTFHGNIMGNVVDNLDFATNSYTLFGNSYTAPIDIKQLIATVKEGAGDDVAGSIYLWSVANQGYVAENTTMIESGMSEYTEIPALHTFIMLNNGQATTTALDYEATVWTPMMNKINPSAPTAPANRVQEGNMMRLRISSENGHADDIVLMEQNQFSAEFEDGADADKYFNTENVNIYTTMDSKNLSILASDNMEGTNLSVQTVSDIEYTITFTKVVGSDYALLDNATGMVTPIVTDGTYTFNAQPNSTLEGRFQIITAAQAPTNMDKVVNKKAAKGIYSMTGAYLGDAKNFKALPQGVYIVNGIRIVK